MRISGHSRRNLYRFYGRFTKATQRHANIRENIGPPLGTIQVKVSHQRSPHAVKFEDRSQETERRERCALGDAWRLAKNILKLKEKNKATFFSLTNEWSLQTPSVTGASMHMLSRKDLNSAELGTVRVPQNSDDGCYSQRRSAYKRSDRVCQRIGFIRDCESFSMIRPLFSHSENSAKITDIRTG